MDHGATAVAKPAVVATPRRRRMTREVKTPSSAGSIVTPLTRLTRYRAVRAELRQSSKKLDEMLQDLLAQNSDEISD